MNIEIANRLVDLRKKSGLSQEELAAQLGLSRQAVSKWERAEASPDTDNLICLAKLYGVSLDDLLNTDEPVEDIIRDTKDKEEEKAASKEEAPKEEAPKQEKGTESVHIGSDGLHAYDKDGSSVHIDSTGIHVHDSKDGDTNIDKNGIVVNDKKYSYNYVRKNHVFESIVTSSIALLATIAYLLMGFLWTDKGAGWAIGWNVFFLIPIVSSIFPAIRKRRFNAFCFPVLVTMVYLTLGMVGSVYGSNYWHPYWVMFLAIPVYYAIFSPIDEAVSRHRHLNGDYDDSYFDFDGESLDKKIERAESDIKKRQAKVDDYNDQIKAKQNKIDALKAKIAAARADTSNDDAEDDIDDYNEDIADAKDDIDDIEDDLKEAEEQLESSKNALDILKIMRDKKHSHKKDENPDVVDVEVEDK